MLLAAAALIDAPARARIDRYEAGKTLPESSGLYSEPIEEERAGSMAQSRCRKLTETET